MVSSLKTKIYLSNPYPNTYTVIHRIHNPNMKARCYEYDHMHVL